ncbi:MAG: ROK family protein [Pyrinomonadaceae bacterium]|nr:ROK family protein [Pyrinomonadaceae bacterium]
MTNEASKTREKLVGVEISNSVFKAVCLDGAGSLLDSNKVLFDSSQLNLPQLADFINQLRKTFGDFDRIGIAVPGLVRQDTKRVAYSTNIPEHSEIDLTSEIEAATNLKITIENDANAAAYGEFRLGAGRGSDNMFYATLGRGVGGALIFDGKLWRGASGFAGEFGYIAVNSDGMKLEDIASTTNIVRRTRSRFHQDNTSSLSQLAEEEITLGDIVREAKNNDDFAQMMLRRTGMYVGTAIAGVINLLNIEKIVVGGEIMEAKHLVLDAIISRARELAFFPSFEKTQIVEGELGENAAAVGAALLANEID